jgi:hypothetical protein
MIGNKGQAIGKHMVGGARIGAAVDIVRDWLGDKSVIGLESTGGDWGDCS